MHGRAERWLFESHPFLGPVLSVWILEIPWLVCFFPGTVEPDARHQLLMSFGMAGMTGHHPVLVTKLMGKCMYIGRLVFGADDMGIFLYTFFQFGMQSLVIAYTVYVLGRMKTPLLIREGALAFYSLYPIFPIWGYTMVKDTGYYIFILLFVSVLMNLLCEEGVQPKWWQALLLLLSTAGIASFRKDGCCVVILTLAWGFVAYKRYRKTFVLGIVSCMLSAFLINGVYMKIENIPKGSVREALSVPIQQTARYVKEHYEEITPEELKVLQTVFIVDISELAELYDPEISDPVKGVFALEPDSSDFKAYLGVWWQQLLKHPDTYVQAFLNHTYGYFYPDKTESREEEDIGVFRIAESDQFDLKFGIKSDVGRNFLEGYARWVKRLPALGMFYSVGLHTWILLGCFLHFMIKKKWQELIVYIPGVCILLVCVFSPVNTCVRYMLPVMALLPIHLGGLTKKL